MPAEPFPGHGQRDGDAPRPGEPGGRSAGDGPGRSRGPGGQPAGRADGGSPFRDGDGPAADGDDGVPEWAFPDDRPPGGGDWWPAEDFEEPWPDYAAMTPVDAGPAAGLDPGLDAGFLPRDAVPGQQGRAGSGFTSGHAFDTSLPGPSLAGALDAATGAADGYKNLDDDELIGVLAGWQKTEAWAAAGRLAAIAEMAARRPAPTRKEAATRGGAPAGWNKFCADEVAVALALSRRSAERMVPLAHDLATRLPLTRQALADGVIGDYKAQLIAEATRVLGDAAAGEAEAAVVPDARDRQDAGADPRGDRPGGHQSRPGRGAAAAGGSGKRSPGGAVAGGCWDRGDLRVRAAGRCGAGRRPGHHHRRHGAESRRAGRHDGPAARPRLSRRPAREGLPPRRPPARSRGNRQPGGCRPADHRHRGW